MRYTDPSHTAIDAGAGRVIPADPSNADYALLLASGVAVLPYAQPPPTASDVRAEASRRLQLLTGARDAGHLAVILSNATREAVRLQDIRLAGGSWTAEQAARVAALRAADAAVEAIREASNVLETQPPADYAADGYWPS